MTLSNRLPKDQLLLGKFLGGLFVIFGSLIISTLVAMFIMLIHPTITVTNSALIRILCMFTISALYLVCFYTITLFVSVAVNRPAISLMILLQIWIFLIVIYPNLGIIISKQLVKLPTTEELSDRKRAVFEPYQEEYKKNRDAFSQMVRSGQRNREIQLKNVELSAKMTELYHQVDVDFSNRLTQQMRVAQNISMFSPAVLYDMIMQRFACTDIKEFDSFMQGVERSWYKYVERYKLRYTDIEAYRKEKIPEFSYPSESLGKSLVATLPQWLITFLVSMVILTLFIPKILSLSVLIRIFLMQILSLVYLSIFVFLGLLVSSLIHRSSLVLLVLLAVWICFVFIIPNISGILSDKLTNIPSEYQTAQQVGPMIQKEVWERIDKIRERAEQGKFETKEEILAETDRAFEEAQLKVRGYYTNFRNAMKQRTNTARNMSRLSPTALFQYASEGIANSGPFRQEHFMEDVQVFSKIYDDYIQSKLGKVVGTSNWSFGTGMIFKGEYVDISSPSPEEYNGDKSDFPRFVESESSITLTLRDAFLDIAGLLLWNLILAVLAFIAFIRCDVR